jgi:hypothetical protein
MEDQELEGRILHMQLYRQALGLPVLNIRAVRNQCYLIRLEVFALQGCYAALIVR